MYLPYLRGKQFELEAVLGVSNLVFNNTTPIIEPVLLGRRRQQYATLRARGIPIILVTNPYHPSNNRLTINDIDSLIDTELANHPALTLGYLIDSRFNIQDFVNFVNGRVGFSKALIFRYDLSPGDLALIQQHLGPNVSFLIFDQNRTSQITQNIQNPGSLRILLSDGFQREARNADYNANSHFHSTFNTYANNGWSAIGDYLTVGDHFSSTRGGQAYVVTLHITRSSNGIITTHHFSSITNPNVGGLPAQKFGEANQQLVNDPQIAALNSTGLDWFRQWENTAHYPGLGAPKKASMIHHIELMSSLV